MYFKRQHTGGINYYHYYKLNGVQNGIQVDLFDGNEGITKIGRLDIKVLLDLYVLEPVSESEFQEKLTQVIKKLGINILKFNFIKNGEE